MRVTSIAVKGLFGIFDHVVPLRSAERVTIIHGPNGFGKTVILRMIAAIVQGKKEIFERTPFNEFSVILDDGSSRIIRRYLEKSAQTKPHVRLELLIRDAMGNTALAEPLPAPEVPRKVLSQVDAFIPSPYRLSGSVWTDGSRAFSLEEILKFFPGALKALPAEYQPDLMFDLSRHLKVFFCRDQPPCRRNSPFKAAYPGVLPP